MVYLGTVGIALLLWILLQIWIYHPVCSCSLSEVLSYTFVLCQTFYIIPGFTIQYVASLIHFCVPEHIGVTVSTVCGCTIQCAVAVWQSFVHTHCFQHC